MSRVKDEYWARQQKHELAGRVYDLEQVTRQLAIKIQELEFIIGYHNLQVKIPDKEKPFSSAHQNEKKSH